MSAADFVPVIPMAVVAGVAWIIAYRLRSSGRKLQQSNREMAANRSSIVVQTSPVPAIVPMPSPYGASVINPYHAKISAKFEENALH